MGIVMAIAYGSQPSEYTTIDDVRNAGAPISATDDQITQAILNASAVIDSIIPGGFPEQVTKTRKFFDIRSWPMVLPKPFVDITQVTISGSAVDNAFYEVTDTGLMLYSGWPFYYGFFGGGRSGFRGGSIPGATVAVTATWGWIEIPYGVQQAAITLALEVLGPGTGGGVGGTDVNLSDLSGISVEAFSLQFKDPAKYTTGSTSGNISADRFLDQYKRKIGVL